MYSNLGCGLFTVQIEATSTSNPSTNSILDLQQISIPCLPNCTGIEITPLRGTASVSVNAPNATLNINLNRPAILLCRLNDGPQHSCKLSVITEISFKTIYIHSGHDKFTYTNLAVRDHAIEIIATSPCDARHQIAYRTNITIGAPGEYSMPHNIKVYLHVVVVDGGWGAWINLSCSINTRCGIGVRIRVRGCVNPPPQNGGKPCRGEHIIREPCGIPCANSKIQHVHTSVTALT